MRAVRFRGSGPPSAGSRTSTRPGEVLVDVATAGDCGTELHP